MLHLRYHVLGWHCAALIAALVSLREGPLTQLSLRVSFVHSEAGPFAKIVTPFANAAFFCFVFIKPCTEASCGSVAADWRTNPGGS